MRERPILLNSEMVRAVLDGRKSQTRRDIKFPFRDKNFGCELSGNELAGEVSAGNYRNCPFGAVGDRLWVRETWQCTSFETNEYGHVEGVDYMRDIPKKKPESPAWGVSYEADGFDTGDAEERGFPWRPSIHMPRWASRITLDITAVRIERLQDISQADAIAEGGPPSHPSIDAVSREYGFPDFSRSWFDQTWWSIYGKESWQANSWVWVIEFRRVEVSGE